MSNGQSSSRSELPTATSGDALYIAIRAGLASLPVVGAVLAEVFNATVTSPIDSRRAAWWQDLQRRVEALERSGVNMQNLADNAEFRELVRRAAQLANENTRQEKLDALRNVILNAASGIDIEADERQLFLQLVEQLTPSQLKLLEFLDDPRAYGQTHGVRYGNYMTAGVDTILEEAFHDWKGKREIYDLVLNDLQTRGLVAGDVNTIHSTMSATDQGIYARRTTNRGRRFLQFIKTHA